MWLRSRQSPFPGAWHVLQSEATSGLENVPHGATAIGPLDPESGNERRELGSRTRRGGDQAVERSVP